MARGGGRGKKKPTIKDLSYGQIDPVHFDALDEEIKNGTDRSAALIGAALIDASLEKALWVTFAKAEDPSSEHAELFRSEGAPFSSFASKIKLARAIGLISHDAYRAFNLIRIIRNTFAHSVLPLKFEEPLVAKECAKIQISPSIFPDAKVSTPRLRYVAACALATVSLEEYVTVTEGLQAPMRRVPGQLPTSPRTP